MTRTLRSWYVALACLTCAGWAFSVEGIAGAPRFQGRGGRPDVPPGGGAPAPQQPQKGSALVLGQAVDATTGQPVAEATVTVTSRVPVASLATAASPTGPLRLITGADGQFVLHDL